MDPMQLFQLQQMMRQQGAGMQPQMAAQQPLSQLPSYTQPLQPQQLPTFGAQGQPQQAHHGGGFNPLMALSPMGGMMASHPGAAMFALSPALGFARMFGAFK